MSAAPGWEDNAAQMLSNKLSGDLPEGEVRSVQVISHGMESNSPSRYQQCLRAGECQSSPQGGNSVSLYPFNLPTFVFLLLPYCPFL